MLRFFKYHGAGNDFLIADNREGNLSLGAAQVQRLCDRHTGFGADGVMLLERASSPEMAFRMVFFNPDGSGGMMCGNGGRCIVAFAADLGLVRIGQAFDFEAPDGRHSAVLLSEDRPGLRTVRLRMKDVQGLEEYSESGYSLKSCFLDTGTRHFVRFVTGLRNYPVVPEGRIIRHDPRFAPIGTNANFVEAVTENGRTVLHVRTFEKGVEDETLACGTGIVASALAAYSQGVPPSYKSGRLSSEELPQPALQEGKLLADNTLCGRETTAETVEYDIKSAIASLSVEFRPADSSIFRATEIWLTGPAEFIGTAEINL